MRGRRWRGICCGWGGGEVEPDEIYSEVRSMLWENDLPPIPVAPDSVGNPRFGLWEGFGVSDSFFEPLPDALLQAFNGE